MAMAYSPSKKRHSWYEMGRTRTSGSFGSKLAEIDSTDKNRMQKSDDSSKQNYFASYLAFF